MDANDEFNKMIDDEVRDAVVLAFANTFTLFTATRSGKKLTAVHKDENPWWRCADRASDDSVTTCSKVQAAAFGAGLGRADMRCGNARGKGKTAGGGSAPTLAQ